MVLLLFTCILSDTQEVYVHWLFTWSWGLSVCNSVIGRVLHAGVSPPKSVRGGGSATAVHWRVVVCTGRSWQTQFSTTSSIPSHTDEQSHNATGKGNTIPTGKSERCDTKRVFFVFGLGLFIVRSHFCPLPLMSSPTGKGPKA